MKKKRPRVRRPKDFVDHAGVISGVIYPRSSIVAANCAYMNLKEAKLFKAWLSSAIKYLEQK